MKKIVLFFAFLSAISLSAQEIDDGGFESKWGTYSLSFGSGTYEDYSADDTEDLIKTLNSLIHLNSNESPTAITAFKETADPHFGNYAIKVVSTLFLGGVFFVPGVFGTVGEEYAEEYSRTEPITVYLPYDYKPLRLEGYLKYAPVGADSATIEVMVYNEDIVIGQGVKKYYSTVSSWEKFEIDVEYSMPDAIATDIRMLFISSAGYNFDNLDECKGNEGSTLWIDDIRFKYELGLEENLMDGMKVKVYPNPSSEIVKFAFPENVQGKLVLYDIMGTEIYTEEVNGDITEINVSDFASGTYLYRFIKGREILSRGKFLKD